jgi:hypothetical protein
MRVRFRFSAERPATLTVFFEMLDACVQDLFDAKEFRPQQIASICDAAVRIVEAAIHIGAEFAETALEVAEAAVIAARRE